MTSELCVHQPSSHFIVYVRTVEYVKNLKWIFMGILTATYIIFCPEGKLKLQWWFIILKTSFDARCLQEERDDEEDEQKCNMKHIVMNHGCEFLGESCIFARLAAADRLKKLIAKKSATEINLQENHLRGMKWSCLWILRVSLLCECELSGFWADMPFTCNRKLKIFYHPFNSGSFLHQGYVLFNCMDFYHMTYVYTCLVHEILLFSFYFGYFNTITIKLVFLSRIKLWNRI